MPLFAIKTGNGVTDGINVGAIKAFQIGENNIYWQHSFVLQIVIMRRVTILVLSIPLFILVIIVAVVDGFGQT